MPISKSSDITLTFKHQASEYKLKGLMLINFNLKNQFLHQLTILSEIWSEQIPTAQQLLISLKGDYHISKEQLILKAAAFNHLNLEFSIELAKQKVVGEFFVSQYELFAKYDNFLEYELSLINISKITLIA